VAALSPVLAVVGVLGLAIGSFLNVVIHRVPRGESVLRPPSHCPQCQVAIRGRHNVPVLSWLLLRGRCAHCATRISPRYPLVELGTAALFVAVTVHFGLSWELPAYLYLAAVAIALALIDVDALRLPDGIVLPSYLVGAALLIPAGAARGGWVAAIRALAAMALLWGLYYGLSRLRRGGMGFGDVKLAGLLGLYLGWLGWGPVAVGTFAAFCLGGAAGGALLVARRAGRRTAIPFGPYMLAGALLAVFVGVPVWTWYGSLLAPAA
jgi:leader peptidase (prepilin peptidase) / N-methyltransferase